jgi:hypothetical protein
MKDGIKFGIVVLAFVAFVAMGLLSQPTNVVMQPIGRKLPGSGIIAIDDPLHGVTCYTITYYLSCVVTDSAARK